MPDTIAFRGMHGTGKWTGENIRKFDWERAISHLHPNGDMVLTNLQSRHKSKKTRSARFYHWEEELPKQGGAVAGVFTDPGLSTAYVSGGVTGNVVHAKVTAALSNEFRVGHEVMLRDSDDPDVDVHAVVTAVVANGSSSYVACKLIEDDDNATATGHDLSDADTILGIGDVSEEGAAMPDAISYEPTEAFNYTQIMRYPLRITGTEWAEEVQFDPKAYREKQRQALEMFGVQQEKTFLWGIRYMDAGPKGQKRRFTEGIIAAIKRLADSDHVDNYRLNASFAGKKWRESGGGKDWWDQKMKILFQYGAKEKEAVCGSGALLGIQQLVEASAHMNIETGQDKFGIEVMKWITVFGTVNLRMHPLFSHEVTNQYSMLVYEPSGVVKRPLRPTIFKPDRNRLKGVTEGIGVDGINEEWLGEYGWQFKHPGKWGWLTGVGQDNARSG